MNFSSALPTFIITLREGVEAALVVGIVLASLKKAKQSQLNYWVYAGIGVGIALSALIGTIFTQMIQWIGVVNPKYAPVIEPLLEGGFSVLAIAMLSWMLLWMTWQAKLIKAQIEGAIAIVLKQSVRAGWGVFSLILIAVVREGFEAVLFIAAKFQEGVIPALGAMAGIATAAGIGVLLFKWGIKINIRKFFLFMGILLLLIIAGLVVTSLGHFDAAIASLASMDRQSQSLCFFYERFVKQPSCILGPKIWDLSGILPDEKFPGLLLSAMFGYTQRLFFVQAVAYIVFLVTFSGLYFHSLNSQTFASEIKHQTPDS